MATNEKDSVQKVVIAGISPSSQPFADAVVLLTVFHEAGT